MAIALADPAEAVERAIAAIASAAGGRIASRRDNPGGTPAAYTIRLAGSDAPFVNIRLIDGIYSWTFDADESLHMSRRSDVMIRILSEEIVKALSRETR